MLLVISTVACAADYSWTGFLNYVPGSGNDAVFTGTTIKVDATANLIAGLWNWDYLVTPQAGVADISIVRIDLTSGQLATISNVSNNVLFSNTVLPTKGIRWAWVAEPNPTLGTGPGNVASGTFSYKSTWGPAVFSIGRAEDDGQYNGVIPGPIIPEPSSIIALLGGLGSLLVIRRRRA
jgi:hypothetical protein